MTSRTDRGSVSVFVVSMTIALLLVAGLVSDGGRVLNARRDADAVASAAARAGAQGIDETGLRSTDRAPLDPDDARARALHYLDGTGYRGTVTATGDSVTVSVTRTERLQILSLAGLHSADIHGSGQAHAVRSIRGAP